MYSIKKQKKIKQKASLWNKEKEYLNIQQDIEHEKEQIKNKYKEQKRKLSMTKFLMYFLFISCSVVQLFTIYITIKIINIGFEIDLTPLTMLITAVVAQVIGFAIYALKSTKENTKGGIIYQTALLEEVQKTIIKKRKNNNNIEEEEIEENLDEQEVQG